MAISQEFGDRPPAPTGITGDHSVGHESGSETSRQALLAQRAFLDSITDKVAAGNATPDEEALLQRAFQADHAHGYN